MKKEIRKELNTLIEKAKGTPQRNDVGTCQFKDMVDAKKMNKDLTANIAMREYKKWKRS